MTESNTDTMLNKTNRNLIVGSEVLFISNNLLSMFSKDHDIFTFHHERNQDIKQTARQAWRDLKPYLQKDYDNVIFMGYRDDSDVVFDLFETRKLTFDAAVFVNYEPAGQINNLRDSLYEMKKAKTKIYSFSYGTDKNRLANLIETHQSLPIWTNLRSARLAQEIFGCILYENYEMTSLSGTNTEFIT